MATGQGTHQDRARASVTEINQSAGTDPIRVGVITPLQGPGDPAAGELVVRGACLGVEYVREHRLALGRGIELVLYDDQATAATEGMARSASAQMVKLALVEDVVAALGQWHLRTTPWTVDVATRYNLPFFVENGHSLVTAQKRRNVFRTYFSIADRVPVMLDYAAAQGMRRVGLLAADTVFSQMTADTLERYGATHHGMEFLRLDFEQDGAREFGDALEQVRRYGPDLFINGGVVDTNYQIIAKALEVGLLPDTPMMVPFGYPLRSDDFWRLAGRAGVGTMWPTSCYRPSWPGMTDIGRWFIDRYTKRYGTFPADTALSHFTDVTIIARAVTAARSTDRDDVIDALEAMEFPSWRGPIRFGRGPAHWHHECPELILMRYDTFGQSFDDASIIHPAQPAPVA